MDYKINRRDIRIVTRSKKRQSALITIAISDELAKRISSLTLNSNVEFNLSFSVDDEIKEKIKKEIEKKIEKKIEEPIKKKRGRKKKDQSEKKENLF